MAAYFGTWRVVSAAPVPPALIALARKLVGGMFDTGVPQRTWRLDDGSVIHALIVNGIPKVTVTQASGVAEQVEPFSDLWMPRGFVVYPAFNTAKLGYGLPIVANIAAGPYDKTNLAPGLDLTRWTAGGPCGEVLVSQDTNAGYPTSHVAITVPLLFHPTLGPTFHWAGTGYYDQRASKAAWRGYRMELAAPVANYSDEDVAASKALFEAINTYRTGNGQKALNLLPRGYYRPAKIMASIMLTAGSTAAVSASYPSTYQTEDDRLTKDGFSADVSGVTFPAFARGSHTPAYELRHLGGAAAGALAAWQAVPADNAVLLKDVGPAAFSDVGYRGGYWAANVVQRSRWIGAGNMGWQSADPALPPLSWHGFASVNLAWETYPANYDPTNYQTAPLVPIRSFTDAHGDCWLSYPRSTAPTVADMEPALSRSIYCRGRAIAQAPRGGLVWAASLIVNGTSDRLLALVHHPEDQPADYTHEGYTRRLRVWWADIPKRGQLRADAQKTICGEDAADPWGWRGGELIDLGMMPAPSAGFVASTGVNSLKMASSWRFSADGKRAICLRDYGTFTDYSTIRPAAGYVMSAALNSRAVELSFTLAPTSTATAVVFHDYTAGLGAADRLIASGIPPDTQDAFNLAVYEQSAFPIAVDYASDGSTLYAYAAKVSAHQSSSYVPADSSQGFLALVEYIYVGIGPATARYATDLQYRLLHGARFQTPSTNVYHELALVLDVRSATFALKVSRPRYAINPAAAGNTISKLATPCPTFTTDLVNGVRLCRLGAMLHDDWYPCPDGAVFTINDECATSLAEVNSAQVYLPQAASANVQGYYAERFGEHVFGYQCAPVPKAVPVLGALPGTPACGCWMTSTDLGAAHWMAATELNPRGGRAVSSVPMPANDWFLYSKVV